MALLAFFVVTLLLRCCLTTRQEVDYGELQAQYGVGKLGGGVGDGDFIWFSSKG